MFLDDPGRAGLSERLAEDVRFHGPVADYEGRADVAHLFTTIAGVMEEVEPVRELGLGSECATFVAGRVRGRTIEGVVDEHHDDEGRVVQVTLMLRPLAALEGAVAAMRSALAASPLPSSRPSAGAPVGHPVSDPDPAT
jgi:hypothetical protein